MLSNVIQSLFYLPLLLVSFFTNAQSKEASSNNRLKSLQHKKVMEANSLLNSVKFRNIGPSIMGGRVVDVDVNPSDPTEFYVAYASGGVWYTHNNGQSFSPVFDSADVLTIGDIAVNWKAGTIWVGTGEVNSSRSSYAGIGIYKSSDKGKTWNYSGLPESHHIGKILLHPTDSNIVWVAVLGHLYSPNKERGVYKTTDGGRTWKQTLYADDNTGAVDLDINPLDPDIIYASLWYRTRKAWIFEPNGKSGGIFRSNDGGETWKLISGNDSGFPEGNSLGRIGLAVYPKNPQIVYAVLDNQAPKPDTAKKDSARYVLKDFKDLSKDQFLQLDENRLDTFLKYNGLGRRYKAKQIREMVEKGEIRPTAIYDYIFNDDGFQGTPIGCEVYRSENGGNSWKKVNTKDISIYNTYGYYFGKVFVSPYNDQKIVLTGFDLIMSNDGGKTFEKLNSENVHGDHHVAWIDPANDHHMIIGNDGGCDITYDNGNHWFNANTPAVGQFYSVVTDNAKPYHVYGGLQDNGVWYGPSDNKENAYWHNTGNYPFKFIYDGDGMQVQVDTRDNTTTYAGSQFGNYSRFNRLAQGETSKRITPRQPLGEKPYKFNWQAPILISHHNQDVIYFGGNKFFRSLNKADTMMALSGDLSKNAVKGNVPFGTITTITESPLRFGLLYIGTDDGNIQISKDGGYSWTLLNGIQTRKSVTIPGNLWVSRLVASKYKEGRVFATLNGYRNDDFVPYLYISEDYGNTWVQLGKDLPMEPVNVVREDPMNDSILYVGTDGGLYVTFDRGQSFMLWNAGLPNGVPVHDIAIQERENEIVLGTHGRSIYISSLTDVQGLKKDKDWLKHKSKEPEK